MDLLSLAAGGIIGFLASLAASYAWHRVTAPNLLPGEVFPIDADYMVSRTQSGGEVRVLVVPGTPGVVTRSVSFHTLSIRNAPYPDIVRHALARQMAWATQAFLEYRQFTPGQVAAMTGGRRFQYYGRWDGSPEPTTPSPPSIRRGERVDVPHGREEGVHIALKVDGDNDAWGFTNDSYRYSNSGKGLWRHPDYEMKLGTHFLVSIRVECPGSALACHYHVNNSGTGRHDLVVHKWGSCATCAALSAGKV